MKSATLYKQCQLTYPSSSAELKTTYNASFNPVPHVMAKANCDCDANQTDNQQTDLKDAADEDENFIREVDMPVEIASRPAIGSDVYEEQKTAQT